MGSHQTQQGYAAPGACRGEITADEHVDHGRAVDVAGLPGGLGFALS